MADEDSSISGGCLARSVLVLGVALVPVAADQISRTTNHTAVLVDLDLAVVVFFPRHMAGVSGQWNQAVVVLALRTLTGLPRQERERLIACVVVPLGLAGNDGRSSRVAVDVEMFVRFDLGPAVKDARAYSESGGGSESVSLAALSSETSEYFGSESPPTFTAHAAVLNL